jgi:two-component system nitrogen regulation sensor histidine kinase GlnL
MNHNASAKIKPSLTAVSAETVLDHLITATMVLDHELKVVFVNSATESLLHCSAGQIIGTPLNRILLSAQELQTNLRKALRDYQPFTARETLLQLPDNLQEEVDLSVSILENGQYLVLEMYPTTRLARINQSKASSDRQTTSRGLIRGLAHEVKNPLGGIRGAAQLLERALPNEALAEYTGVIISEADRLKDLVDRMLGPHQRPSFVPVYLPEVCEHVIALAASEFTDKVEWVRDYDPSLPDIEADRDQIIQSILNVVRNACEALSNTSAAKVTLQTRIARQFTIGKIRHRQVMCINIIDNGPGIDPRDLERIFYPMISGRANGSGLGLSITQHIISEHNGVIQVGSTFGNTVFSIFLPFEQPTTSDELQERK